jgi:hypothetical protein
MCPNENPRKSSRTLKRPIFRLVGRRRISSEIARYRFDQFRFCEDLIGRDAGIRTRGKTAPFLGNSGMGARMCPIAECQLHWASGQLARQVPAPIAGARRPVWPDRPRQRTTGASGRDLGGHGGHGVQDAEDVGPPETFSVAREGGVGAAASQDIPGTPRRHPRLKPRRADSPRA